MIFALFVDNLRSQTLDENSKVPIDPNIKIGKLDNGLVYYIKRNTKPEKRVELILAVNAGSILEEEQEQGLAHFLEHMCFNGTKSFPKNELINVIERMGIVFGPDLNAYTSFDETVYMLKIPTDSIELINKGFQILEEWAHLVIFDPKEIEKEKGVVLEEWRLGLGADDRMRKKAFPIIFKGSKYAERLPIGKPETIKSFNQKNFLNFYKKWYRPDLMAVIVVGDIDVEFAENKIKSHFSKLTNPPNAPKREIFDIPDNTDPLISIQTDPEATSSDIAIITKHNKKKIEYIRDFKGFFITKLINEMLDNRLIDKEQNPESSFLNGSCYYGRFLAKTKDAFYITGQSKENKILQAFEELYTEMIRAQKHGFLASELERAKKSLLKKYETQAKEYDKIESFTLAMSYVYNYLLNEPIPGSILMYEYAKHFIPQITLEEINSKIKELITDHNLIVMITAPQKENIKIPTEEDIKEILNSIRNTEISPYVDNYIESPLIEEDFAPVKIINEHYYPDFDYTEYVLENNVKVIIKSTDFKNDEIVFSSYNLGGLSLAEDNEVLNAMYIPQIIEECGLSYFKKSDLIKKLAGKNVRINSYIAEIKHGITGNCSPSDLETALQLIYLYYTSPRKGEDEFKAFISKMKSQFKFIRNSPRAVFIEHFTKIITQNNPRIIVFPTDEQLENINLEKSLNFYKHLYNNNNGTIFFFVGNINKEEALPLIQKYIGNLPTSTTQLQWRNVNPKFPSNIIKETIYKGMEEQGFVGIAFNSPFNWTYENAQKGYMLIDILKIMLRETIREKEGGTYGVYVQGEISKIPEEEFSLIIFFGTDPKKQEYLTKKIFKQISSLQKSGPSKGNLQKVKEQIKKQFEVNLKENKWWLNRLENSHLYQYKLLNKEEYFKLIDSFTADDIKAFAQKYINLNNYVVLYLKPEKNKK